MMRQTLSKLGRVAFAGAVSLCAVLAIAGSARADVVSDQSGAILIFPKLVFDSTADLTDAPTDTVVQITNTSNSRIAAHCVLVDTTSRCDGTGDACTPETAVGRCGAADRCIAGWVPRDFRMTLTKRQPITWRISEGLPQFPCEVGGCPNGQSNESSSIPLVSDDPFYGEMKCVQVDPDTFEPSGGLNPANGGRGDLAGHATVLTVGVNASNDPDARKHNAIALQATATNNNDETLQIGGTGAEYSACPHTLLLNHEFDDATVVYGGGETAQVTTNLTVIPCTQDLGSDSGGSVSTLQFLIFNEFEQRFSASSKVDCWRDVQLSDLNSRPGSSDNAFSVFNVGVQGTIAGQTRIRPVAGPDSANAVLAIAEQTWDSGLGRRTSAANVHFTGVATGGDVITIPTGNVP